LVFWSLFELNYVIRRSNRPPVSTLQHGTSHRRLFQRLAFTYENNHAGS
jgi:hypothetical protein